MVCNEFWMVVVMRFASGIEQARLPRKLQTSEIILDFVLAGHAHRGAPWRQVPPRPWGIAPLQRSERGAWQATETSALDLGRV